MTKEDRNFVEMVELHGLADGKRLCRIIRALEAKNEELNKRVIELWDYFTKASAKLAALEAENKYLGEIPTADQRVTELSAKLAALEKERADAPVVYGEAEPSELHPHPGTWGKQCKRDTHRARLVDIQEIK